MYMSLVQKDDVSARHIPPRAEFSVLETPWVGEKGSYNIDELIPLKSFNDVIVDIPSFFT